MEQTAVEETKAEPKKEYKIWPASPDVLAKCDPEKIGLGLVDRGQSRAQAKYPFEELLIGEAFAVPFNELSATGVQPIRAAASSSGKRKERKFVVVVHSELGCVEVARIS